MPPLSNYFGGLNSDLDDGDQIVEFVSAGPKKLGLQNCQRKSSYES